MTDEQAPFEGWAILELMGHRRLAGFVREQEIAGAGFLRIDVPAPRVSPDPGSEPQPAGVAATQFYSPSSVYCLTPTDEEAARRCAERWHHATPIHRLGLDAGPMPDPDQAATGDDDDIPF